MAASLLPLSGTGPIMAQKSSVGMFDGHGDIGAVLKPGSARYDAKTGQYELAGSGYNVWAGGDFVFGKEVAPDDHPFYKQVYLRILPINDGNPAQTTPKVVAYVYGGQGTINTPSWSPDSKQIAFISNSAPLVQQPVSAK